jgi:hypothetical protein
MEFLMDLPCVVARLCRGITSVLLTILCIAAVPRTTAAADTESLAFAVKATYLTKFGYYVEWPKTAFPALDSAVNLCVVGEDPFGATLDKAASEERIGGRAIVIRRLQEVERDSGCHILYISGSETQRGSQMIEAVHGSSVLTVSDASRPGTAAAIVHFVIRENRVRFEIDEDAAAQNGLTISSRLLSLALTVKPRH